jgi:ABC-type glutathione transport system ATPase component
MASAVVSTQVSTAEAVVSLEGVHKSYALGQTTVPALRGVNLTLSKGEFTALIGLVDAAGSGTRRSASSSSPSTWCRC